MRVKMPPSVRIVQGDHTDQGMLILHREICCLGRSDAEPPDDLSSCRICQRPFELGGMTRFVRQHVLRQQPPASSLSAAYSSQQLSRQGPASSDEEALGDPSAGVNGGDKGGSSRLVRRVSGDVRSAVTVQVNGGSPPVSPGSEVSRISQMQSTGRPEGKRLRQEDDDRQSLDHPSALSEPMSYACFTCSASFSTAWALIQHVQSEHNLKICASSAKGNCSQAVSPRSETDSPISSPPKYSKTVEDESSMSASRRSLSPPRSILPTLPHPNPPIVSSSHPGASSFDLPFFRLPTADKHFPSLLGSPFSRPPAGHDFRMENIISEQFRLHPHLPLIPFDRRPFDLSTHPRPSLGLPLEPMDFYSQRLRQLAGTNHHSPAAVDLMNARKKPRSSSPAFSTPVSGPSQSAPITPETGNLPMPSPVPGLNSVTGKPKAVRKERPRACEYCHKIFRFQSNLIVHRRIHTGEKPYKCKICSHACTQSSKLKRHMKTHINELDSSIEKNSQASDDVKEEDDSSVQGDEEEEDPMDDEEEDSFDMGETDGPEDLSTKSTYSVCVSLPNEPNTTPTGTAEKSSLVGELMDKFGLSNINAYREAYSQALRESVKEETRDEDFDNEISVDSDQSDEETRDSGKENGSDSGGCDEKPTIKIRNEFLLTQPVLDLSRGTLTGSLDSQYDPTKRVHLSGSEAESGVLPGLWLPPIGVARDFPFAPHATSDFLTQSKGVVEGSLKAVNQQSLRQPFGLKPPGQVSADSSTPPPIGKRDRGQSNRRDTCEFCGKVFKNCSNLTVHRRSHTGEKPYHCTMCSYACAQSSKLTRHMKTHGRMGKDVYQCRFCSMPFSVASTLEKHMRKCVVSQNSKGAGVLPPVLPGH